MIDLVCDRFGMNLSQEERDAIARRKKAVYRQLFQPTPLAGADVFLDTLHRHGYRLAIVTGTLATSAEATLRVLGMRDRIEVIISAEMNIPGKPDPAPFQKAVECLRVDVSECLAVDNAPAGITSATKAGLPCAGSRPICRRAISGMPTWCSRKSVR